MAGVEHNRRAVSFLGIEVGILRNFGLECHHHKLRLLRGVP